MASVFQGPPAYVLLAGSSEVRCASNGTVEDAVATGYWEDVRDAQLGMVPPVEYNKLLQIIFY